MLISCYKGLCDGSGPTWLCTRRVPEAVTKAICCVSDKRLCCKAAHSSGRRKLSLSMGAGRASTAVLCLLCIGLAAAALPSTVNLNERETCYSALDTLQSCNGGLASQDLQQHCCIPFHALEGMHCFCDDDVVSELLVGLQAPAIDGLSACGMDTPFTAIFERQERCMAEAEAAEDERLRSEEEEQHTARAPLTDETLDFTQAQWDRIFGAEEAAVPVRMDSIASEEEESFDDFLDLEDDLELDVNLDLSQDFGIEVVGGDITEIIISDDESEVVFSVPSDVTDVELVIEGVDKEQALPALVAIAQDQSDNSVTSLYDADFSDVNSMMSLISGWLGNALASGGAVEKPVEDEENMGGLSEVLADILANLQATFAGQPLDVEISYEPGSKGSADTEIDIEIDPELVPVLEPQFLDARLLAISQKYNRRAVKTTPGRITEADLLELTDSLEKEAPSLANCFNSGLCNWLCQHRRSLQYALGLETVLLVALFALYARYNRQAQELEMDADEESLRAPLIVSAADYANAAEKEPLWTLSSKVAIPQL